MRGRRRLPVLAVLVLTGSARLWVVCAIAFGTSAVATLFDSASQAALPSLVPTPLLGRAASTPAPCSQACWGVTPLGAALRGLVGARCGLPALTNARLAG